jgi:hypothetical protein
MLAESYADALRWQTELALRVHRTRFGYEVQETRAVIICRRSNQ